MSVRTRLAKTEDLAVIDGLTQRAYAVWQDLLGYPPTPMLEDYRPRIARDEIYLAVAADEIIGLIVLEREGGHDTIFSVAVEPTHAGRGVGSRLMAFAEARARAAGQSELQLYTNALMTRNIELYLKLGYRETARRPNPIRPGFTIVDMAKTL